MDDGAAGFAARLAELLDGPPRVHQITLGRAIGREQSTVSQWKNGIQRPDDADTERIARYFGVSVGWLRYGEGERKPRREPPSVSEVAEGRALVLPREPRRRRAK